MNKLVVAFAFLASFAVPVSAQGLTEAQRPTYKVGDSWTYSFHDTRYGRPATTYISTVENIDGNGMSLGWKNLDLNTSGTDVTNLDLNLILPSSGASHIYPNFHYPLKVGETWHEKYHTAEGTGKWDNSLTTTVVGIETVTVPAGTFEAFKIVAVRDYVGHALAGGSWSGRVTETWWVSPQVKNYVKRVYTDSGTSPSPLIRELLKYHLQ